MSLEKIKINYIYGSYQVDNIEYSFDQIENIIKGITGGETLSSKDYMYINNFSLAYAYWVSNMTIMDYRDLREEHFIKLHKLMMQGIDDKNAGEYRTVCAVSSNARKLMPVPMKLPYIMGDIFYDIENYRGEDFIQFAVDIHFRIIDAYPFVEKNKDMARFILNQILLSSNTIKEPIVFGKKDSDIYKEVETNQDLIERKEKLILLINKSK